MEVTHKRKWTWLKSLYGHNTHQISLFMSHDFLEMCVFMASQIWLVARCPGNATQCTFIIRLMAKQWQSRAAFRNVGGSSSAYCRVISYWFIYAKRYSVVGLGIYLVVLFCIRVLFSNAVILTWPMNYCTAIWVLLWYVQKGHFIGSLLQKIRTNIYCLRYQSWTRNLFVN